MFAERDEELRLSDGTRLVSRIWSPQGAGPWPALLMRQPYGRSIASTVTLAHPRWWADQGFVVVVQDVTEHLQDVVEKVVVHHIDLIFQILLVLLVLIPVKDMVVFHSIIL